MKKRATTLVTALALLVGLMAVPVTASNPGEVSTDGGNSSVPIEVTAAAATFSVTLPTSLPVHVSADGTTTVADNAALANGSAGRIKVTDVTITGMNDWAIVAPTKSWVNSTLGLKEAGFVLNGDSTTAGGGALGLTEASWPAISAAGTLPLTYSAVVAPQSSALTQQIANLVFTVGWDNAAVEPTPTPAPPWSELTPTVVSKDIMERTVGGLEGSVVLSREVYSESYASTGTVTDVSKAQDKSAMAVVSGQNAVVYPAQGRKLAAPANSSSFFFGYSAASLDLRGLDTSKVSTMSGMFESVMATELDLSNFDTSLVDDMSNMFYYASWLENLNVSGFDTSKVTNMSRMFSQTACLSTLDISHFDTSNVVNMADMFNAAKATSGRETLDLSNFDLSSLDSTNGMFFNCKGVKNIVFGGTKASKITNTSGMFRGCNDLLTADIRYLPLAENSVTPSGMFVTIPGITKVTVGSAADESLVRSNASLRAEATINVVQVTLETDKTVG